MAPKPLLRIRSPAKKTFGEAFGAATVAGSAGPGFHTWPSGHIPQDNGSETASSHPVPCQKDVRRGVRRRRCSRVRWPRFPHLAFGPHPSRHGSETAAPHPAPCQKDVRRGVRRGDRGQRPTATEDPNTKQLRRSVHFSTRANGTMTCRSRAHAPTGASCPIGLAGALLER